jgi:hypothetical protein
MPDNPKSANGWLTNCFVKGGTSVSFCSRKQARAVLLAVDMRGWFPGFPPANGSDLPLLGILQKF